VNPEGCRYKATGESANPWSTHEANSEPPKGVTVPFVKVRSLNTVARFPGQDPGDDRSTGSSDSPVALHSRRASRAGFLVTTRANSCGSSRDRISSHKLRILA
jgi:hypothetical protein